MRARFVDLREINLRDEGFRLIDRSVGNDFAGRRADEALPPKFNAVATCGLFMTHAVDSCEKTAVGHGVAALDGLPCIVLLFTFGSLIMVFALWILLEASRSLKSPARVSAHES